MDQGPVYCAACGLRIESPGRVCPKCGEPLPAPPTVIGYADPSQPIEPPPEKASSNVFGMSPLAATPFPLPGPKPAQAPAPPEEPPIVPAPILQQPLPAPVIQQPLPPPVAQLPPQQEPPPKPGTEQIAPAPAALQTSGVAPTVPDGEPMPEPRPRNKPAGALLSIWGLCLLVVCLVFSAIHVSMVVRHGFWNLHDALHAALWMSLALLPAALLQVAAGIANFLGRLLPRVLALIALIAQMAWAIACVVLIHQAFLQQGPVLPLEILAGASVVPTLLGAILSWAGARRRTMVYAPGP